MESKSTNGFKPRHGFAEQSRNRLSEMFQRRFDARQAARKEELRTQEPLLKLTLRHAKDDKDIESAVSEIQAKNQERRGKQVAIPDPVKKTIQPRTATQSFDASFAPNFPFTWTWNAQTGRDPQVSLGANQDGNIWFHIVTGDDNSSGACRVAVGNGVVPDVTSGWMQVSANPSISYNYGTSSSLASARTHAFIGLYVAEYTLDGDFVGAVVDQESSLWTLTTSHDFWGSSSGVPLSAFFPVDNAHYYEIWVWAGGDAEGDGYHTFYAGFGWSNLSVFVPWISVHTY